MEQTRYGLIGSKLGHSYSKIIHEQIADYTYELMPLPTEDEARAFMERRDFAAINVTIPYKQLVIPYCDVVDPKAAAIGAVNTIVNRDGRLYGYNTDYAGFAYLARAHGVDFAGKTVLILGTGGTHSTVTAVCKDGGAAEILTASRTGKGDALTYEEAMRRKDVQVIVNTTPCLMWGSASSTRRLSRHWRPCWMWCTTPSAPSCCCGLRSTTSPPPAALRCWWPRPCLRPNTLPAKRWTPTR